MHLRLRNLVTRMGRQTGIVHPGDGGVLGEKLGDPAGVLGLAFHAQMQCLEAPLQQLAGRRVETAAQMTGRVPDLAGQRGAGEKWKHQKFRPRARRP